MTFIIELHDTVHLTTNSIHGTRRGKFGKNGEVSAFTAIERVLRSPQASDRPWTTAYVFASSTMVAGVWRRDESDILRCLGVHENFATQVNTPYLHDVPVRGLVTGNFGVAAESLDEGEDWARHKFKELETAATAILTHRGQVQAAWDRTATGNARLVATGSGSIFT